ncbi:unnamed protein product [Phytomonas sp. EM1]|nr:unnamed protein product [Phytomonas sp. EM1]|eukprot:CCW62341.1 unnamed protein product [Phytomonas sp. isolate EM1]
MDYSHSENSNPNESGLFEEDHSFAKPTAAQHPSNGFLSLENSHSIEASNDSLTSVSKIEPKDPSNVVVLFDKTKAGLQKVDNVKTELIIRKYSSGSLYYKNEERKAFLRAQRVEAMLEKKKIYEANITTDPAKMRMVCRQVEMMEQELEKERFFDRVFAHIDMDMFYAAVEAKKNPQLREVPFGVGSLQMLSTTNYIARQYGVRSGMPGFIGRKLCPELVIVPVDFESYKAEAAVVRGIVAEYDPDFHAFGLDEQRLDLTDYLRANFPDAGGSLAARYDVAGRVMTECRRRVFEATGLTASAGLGPTPTLAKMASNLDKPNGQHPLPLASREAVMDFMRPLPCREVPGIGKSFDATLRGLGIHTVGEIYNQRHWLSYIFTPKTFCFLLSAALGIGSFMGTAYGDFHADKDPSSSPRADCKSVGNECTFQHLTSRQELERVAYDLLQHVVRRLKGKGLISGRVVLTVKDIEFQVKQYGRGLPSHTDDEAIIRRTLDDLLSPVLANFMNYRLLGVRLEKLIPSCELERPLESRGGGQATLDRFFNKEREKRGREETPLDDDDSVEEEGALPQRTNRIYASHVRGRTDDCHVDNGTRATSLSSASDVVFIDSPSRSPSTAGEATPHLTVSSSPVVMSFHELASVSPPLEAQFANTEKSDSPSVEDEVSNSNYQDDVIIVE